MIHLFRYDPCAIRVDPAGQKAREKFRRGDWQCVLCRVSRGFWERFEGACPGYVTPVSPGTILEG